MTHYYVLEGELVIDAVHFDKGTYIRIDANEEYIPSTTKGCEVLCIYTLGWEKLS